MSIMKKKKTTYKMRQILYAKKLPKLYFTRLDKKIMVTFKRNNMFFNVCSRLRQRPYLFTNLYWTSGGSSKFSQLQYKGATKLTFLANYAFGQYLKDRIIKMNFHSLTQSKTKMCLKGGSRYFSAFYKGFESNKKKN